MTEAKWQSGTNLAALLNFLGERANERKLRLFACACCRRLGRLVAEETSGQALHIVERYADGLAGAAEWDAARALAAEGERRAQSAEAVARAAAQEARDEQEQVWTAAWSAGVVPVPAALAQSAAEAAGTETAATEAHAATMAARAVVLAVARDLQPAQTAQQVVEAVAHSRRAAVWQALAAACLRRVGREEERPVPRRRAALRASQVASYVERLQEAAVERGESVWHAAERSAARAHCDLLRDLFGPLPFREAPADPAWLRWQDGTIPRLAATIALEGRFRDLPVLADALEEAGCTDEVLLDHCRQPREHARACWVLDLLRGRMPA